MKREIIAGLILLAMFAALIFNASYYSRVTGEMLSLTDSAEALVNEDNFSAAADKIYLIQTRWRELSNYTSILIRYSEIENLHDATCDALGYLLSESKGESIAALKKLRHIFTDISEMEQFKFGSIF